MWSGEIVSSAAKAAPGKRRETVFPVLEPPAAPSAQTGKLRHTISHAERIFAIPCIDSSPPNEAAVAGRLFFLNIWKDCKGKLQGLRLQTRARECNHRWGRRERHRTDGHLCLCHH